MRVLIGWVAVGGAIVAAATMGEAAQATTGQATQAAKPAPVARTAVAPSTAKPAPVVRTTAATTVAQPAPIARPAPAANVAKPAPVVRTAPAAPVTRAAVAPRPVTTLRAPVKAPVAVEEATGIGLSAKVSTLGVGGDVTVGVNDYLGVRFGVNGFGWSPSWKEDEGTINGDFQWLSYGAMLDYYPAGGGFRLTGGLLLNKNKVKLTADLDKPVELDGTDYNLSDLKGEITFADTAPYLGFGYGNAVGVGQRWHFTCDFGVMFQGEPKISASAKASDPALQGIVDEALEREVADIQDDANAFQFYPVIAVGAAYKF